MTVCCRCGRHYWPGKSECPGAPTSDGCNHKPCEHCQHYVDEKEKDYGKRTERMSWYEWLTLAAVVAFMFTFMLGGI